MTNANVIPLFGRELPRNDAHTHFVDPAVVAAVAGTEYEWDPDALSTLCGRYATGYLAKDSAYPECAACIEAWRERTGWTFPLPTIVTT